MSHDPDALYRPLGGPGPWAAAASGVDGDGWRAGLEHLRELRETAPAWMDMVSRSMLVAAAYQSGALAGLYRADDAVGSRLLAGMATPASCGTVVASHVVANHAALLLALDAAADPGVVTENWIRRLHAVACRSQETHPVPTDHGMHDHVLGHGDYKHHANHVRTASGDWHAFVPVTGVVPEVACLVSGLNGHDVVALHPVARAAHALWGLTHVGAFAAGNGRVARALAAAPLLGAASIPLCVPAATTDAYRSALAAADAGDLPALVGFVEQRCAALVGLTVELRARADGPEEAAAMQRWRTRVRAAHQLHALLPRAVERALGRHRRRADLGWMSGLADAEVVATGTRGDDDRFDVVPLSVSVPLVEGPVVEEVLVIDVHPVTGDGNTVVLRAEAAELRIEVRPDEVVPAASTALAQRLDALIDRAVTTLAVRVAAAADDG